MNVDNEDDETMFGGAGAAPASAAAAGGSVVQGLALKMHAQMAANQPRAAYLGFNFDGALGTWYPP
jgi:hypothetical protein